MGTLRPLSRRPPENSRFVTALFLIVFAVALVVFLRLLFVYVTAIVLGLVLASLFWPVYQRVLTATGGRRNLAASVVTALVALVVLVPLVFLITSLSAQAFTLYQKASGQELVEQMRKLTADDSPVAMEVRSLAARFGVDLSAQRLTELGADVAKAVGLFLYEQLGGIASNALALLMHFGMMIVLLFAFFAEGERLKAYVLDLSPLPDEQEETIARRFAAISRAVFVGNGLGSILQGVLGGIAFYLFGIGSGALWGAAIAFFAFLPMVGASIVIAPAALYLFLTGHPVAAIGFLVFNGVQIFVLEYIVKTRLIGGQGEMNGVLVFFGMVAGISVFGLLGLFYGPLVLTMFVTLAEIYREHYRDDLLAVHSPWVEADGESYDDVTEPDLGARAPSASEAAVPEEGAEAAGPEEAGTEEVPEPTAEHA